MSNENKEVGRPRLYKTPEEFEAKVFEYQQYCKESKEPVTWTGLALFLGFSSRQSINEYEKYDGFSDVVKRAKLFVEWHYEMRVNGNNAAGPIFVLKNMGWSDKQELAHSSPDGSMSPSPAIDASGLSDETLSELMRARRSPRVK